MNNHPQDIDFKITRLLQSNGRMPNTEIAKKLGVSESTVRNRLSKLITEQSIKIVAVVNPLKAKTGIIGNIRIKAVNKMISRVGQELQKLDEIFYLAQLAGMADFDAEYYVLSQKDFAKLIDKINDIEGITSVEPSVTVRYIKNNWAYGIPGS